MVDISSTDFTYCAPIERAEPENLAAARKAFLANETAVALLDAVADYVVVLNVERQIVAANERFLKSLRLDDISSIIGLRPGEALQCDHCPETQGGCGTGHYCMQCGAVDAIMECIRTRDSITRPCRMLTHSTMGVGAMDLEVHATFLHVTGADFVVLAMCDVSSEKRRQILERIFFHDVLNTATSLRLAASMLHEGEVEAKQTVNFTEMIARLSNQIIEEISAQRLLLAAEQGDLHLDLSEVTVESLLKQVVEAYRHWEKKNSCTLKLGFFPACSLETDVVVLRRVLGNLVKNALEASGTGDTITISAELQNSSLQFTVNNPGVIPEAVQSQIFQRSFSTKEARGRGIGTYSVKLFTERYLGGQVSFSSRKEEGTSFYLSVPLIPGSTAT